MTDVVSLVIIACMVGDIDKIAEEENIFKICLKIISVLIFALSTVKNIITEVVEVKAKGIKKYFRYREGNYVINFQIIVSIILVVQAFLCMGLTRDEKINESNTVHRLVMLRINLVACIMLTMLEFLNRVCIFDFFAVFVRQLKQITYETRNIGAMLGIIVICWALLFWILD